MFSKLSQLRQPFSDVLNSLNMDDSFKRNRFDDDTRNALDADPKLQITNTESMFGDNGIAGNKISELSVDKLIAGTMQIKSYIQSPDYVPNTSGFKIDAGDPLHGIPSSIDIMNGNFSGTITAASMTIAGTGYLRSGKTSFSDSTNAGWYLGNTSEGVYFGAASDASYIKYDIGTGKVLIKADINSNSNIASDTYNFTAGLVAPNALSAKNMGFPIAFGDGRDGDLTVSGTTNIDTSKQYNNITINNGGVLTAASNKYLYLAIKGTLTINAGGKISMIGKGASGGSGGARVPKSLIGQGGNNGSIGSNGAGSGAGVEYLDFTTRQGASAASGASGGGGVGNSGTNQFAGGSSLAGGSGYSSGGVGVSGTNNANGTAGNAGTTIPQIILDRAVLNQNILLTLWGAGGSGGGSGMGGQTGVSDSYGGAGGNGGNGGGAIYIEAYNVVIANGGSIQADGGIGLNGENGENFNAPAPTTNTCGGGGGGGGGGAGGCVFLRYHTLTNSGSNNISANGGTGGTGGNGGSGTNIVTGKNGANGANGGSGLVFTQMI